MHLLTFFLLFVASCFAFDEGGSQHACKVQLDANWATTPFALQVIEAISAYNESLYEPLLNTLFLAGEESLENGTFTDQQVFELAMSFVGDQEVEAIIELQLANKFATPRIQSQFTHYTTSVLPSYEESLLRACGHVPKAWAHLNKQIFCRADDLLAIKSESGLVYSPLPFDRVLGSSLTAPVITLYGNYEDSDLKMFLETLLGFAETGQYRAVWRYSPGEDVQQKEVLSGYGVDLTLKRTDYIAIDDRNKKAEYTEVEGGQQAELNQTLWETYTDDIMKIYEIQNLEFQLMQYVRDLHEDTFDALKRIISDLPKYLGFLSTYPVAELEKWQTVVNETSDVTPGIYFNGRALHGTSLDVSNAVKLLKQERDFINRLSEFGISTEDAKEIIYLLGEGPGHSLSSKRRYNVPKQGAAVVYVNDLEKDSQYKTLKKSRKAYLNQEIRPGQIPAVRENIHDSIFVIKLSDPNQILQFLQFAGTVIYRQLPQQVGIVPLIDDDVDRELAKRFLYKCSATSIKEGFKFLQQISQALTPLGPNAYTVDLNQLDPLSPEAEARSEELLQINQRFAHAFGLSKPQIIANGVFMDFSDNWQYAIAAQLFDDVVKLRELLLTGAKVDSLKSALYEGATERRNTLIISDSYDSSALSFKSVTPAFLDKSQAIELESRCDSVPLTLNIIGLSNSIKLLQVVEWALQLQQSHKCLDIRIITSDDSDHAHYLKAVLESNGYSDALSHIREDLTLHHNRIYPSPSRLDMIRNSFSFQNYNPANVYLILNGRSINLNEGRFARNDLALLIEHERESRLDKMHDLYKKVVNPESPSKMGAHFEEFSSFISKKLLAAEIDEGSIFYENQQTRTCTKYFNEQTSVFKRKYNSKAKIDIVAAIKPVSEDAQKIISMLALFEELGSDFVNIQVLFLPSPTLELLEVNRLYRGVYKSAVEFYSNGTLKDESYALFSNVPEKTLFTFDLDVPTAWVVGIKEGDTDLDNVKLQDTGDVLGVYELEYILVEGYARTTTQASTGGIQVQLSQAHINYDTSVMANLGYLQLKANPGVWEFSLKPDTLSEQNYKIASLSHQFETDLTASTDSSELTLLDLFGATIYPVFAPKKSGASFFSGIKSFFSYENKVFETETAEINIFTVASGHLYERFLGIMTASVMKHTNHSVKFWLIENYMSPVFRENLPLLAQKYGFSYELVTYKWPKWLRPQREKQRTIWGYKILFLDVLFPQNLEKVIFVDADQIVRTDLKELVDMDLEGAPYGYTPMCDSREEMEGFRFWKHGYWDKVLGQRGLKYHISALYVIDLFKFRELMTGDILRQHYQQLSADPASLSNLDQDLPNNLQHTIKIFSLPQEWLWCETWCSDESLKSAKTIDLCNNPLTKEPKLDRARRQIPEWTAYDNEINVVLSNRNRSSSDTSQSQLHDEF